MASRIELELEVSILKGQVHENTRLITTLTTRLETTVEKLADAYKWIGELQQKAGIPIE